MPTLAKEKPISHPRTFDWLPPAPWSCPVCRTVLVTREAAPRCPCCGFLDVAD
jgi:rubrerythrin